MKRRTAFCVCLSLFCLSIWGCAKKQETARLVQSPKVEKPSSIVPKHTSDLAQGAPEKAVDVASKHIRPAVMAPLEVSDWALFNSLLVQAKSIGVVAVSTDVWWGLVEKKGDQEFDWSYYDKVGTAIIDAGLKWVPILSFHQCGGNVGDTCDIPIPKWLWQKLGGDKPNSLKYKSEAGHISNEVIALWSDDKAKNQYVEFIEAFRTHFSHHAANIEEINISAGPSGELRYPSYNSHDDFKYPQRGYLQSYSDAALEDFRDYVKERYKKIDEVNKAWQTTVKTWKEIQPPSDAPGFFYRKDYMNSQYGKDFIYWYNQALMDHGVFMLQLTIQTLENSFPGIPLGIKIPGIHWLMNSPDIPRSAEISAGLINTTIALDSSKTAHGYAPILEIIKEASTTSRPVVLHFTCLEMDNTPHPDAYSLAKDLVFWVGAGADAREVVIMGENALSGGVTSDHGWDNIENALKWSAYSGLTALRIGNLADNGGLGFRRYQNLINQYVTQ